MGPRYLVGDDRREYSAGQAEVQLTETRLRLDLRLAQQMGWLNSGQHKHVSELVNEVGKLLGGRIRQTKAK